MYGIQGLSFTETAEQFGTPFYVYDADVIVGTYRRVWGALGHIRLCYSLKPNPNISVVGLLGSLCGAEVARWSN